MVVTGSLGSLTTGVTWQVWNSGFDTGTGASTTIYTASNGIWTEWISAATGNQVLPPPTFNIQIWASWVSQIGSSPELIRSAVTINGFDQYRVAPEPYTAAPDPYNVNRQKRDREARLARTVSQDRLDRDRYEAMMEEDERNRQKELAAANRKAEALLKSVLNDEQRALYENTKHFYVQSRSGKMYKVRPGKIHNIIMVDPVTKQELLELCVTTENHHNYPDADVMVAQKLMLEHQEAEALRLANIWDLRRGKQILTEAEKRRLIAA